MPARASFPPPMPMLDSTQVYGADGRIVRALPSPGASRRKETERDPRRNRRGKKKTSRGLDSVRENDRVPAASSAASARLRSEKRQSPAASARLCSGERQSPGPAASSAASARPRSGLCRFPDRPASASASVRKESPRPEGSRGQIVDLEDDFQHIAVRNCSSGYDTPIFN